MKLIFRYTLLSLFFFALLPACQDDYEEQTLTPEDSEALLKQT